MARVKVCGVCWRPVLECVCEDEEPEFTVTADEDDAA